MVSKVGVGNKHSALSTGRASPGSDGRWTLETADWALVAALVVSVGAEMLIQVLHRAPAGSRRRDSKSYLLIVVGFLSSVLLAVVLWFLDLGALSTPRSTGRWLGVAVMMFGQLIRWWAVLTLKKFFTVEVALHPGHRLVQTGPYRFARHPSYTGMAFWFLGLGVALNNWASTIALCLPFVVVMSYRIRVEERVLLDAFGADYEEYSKRTKRWFPGIH